MKYYGLIQGNKNCKRCGVLFCDADRSKDDPNLCRCCAGKPPIERKNYPASFWEDKDNPSFNNSSVEMKMIRKLPSKLFAIVEHTPNPDPDGWDDYTHILLYIDEESERLFFVLYKFYPDLWDSFFYCESYTRLSLDVVKKYLHNIGCNLYDEQFDSIEKSHECQSEKEGSNPVLQNGTSKTVQPVTFVIDEETWKRYYSWGFSLGNSRIIFREGWFILISRTGMNSVISHKRARKMEEDEKRRNATMYSSHGYYPILTALEYSGFTIKDDNAVLEKFSVDDLMKGSVMAIPKVLTIPESIDGIVINYISDKAFFQEDEIEKVFFHQNVKLIGSSAFEGCINLKEIEGLSKDAVIKRDAFKNTIYCGE